MTEHLQKKIDFVEGLNRAVCPYQLNVERHSEVIRGIA